MRTTKRETIGRTILECSASLVNSLQGYEDSPSYAIDKQLIPTFKKIASCFEEKKEAISFISFADTELKGRKVSDWEVEPDEGQFFYAPIGNRRDKDNNNKNDSIINDYYYFKSVLADTAIRRPRWLSKQEKELLSTSKSSQLAYILEDAFIYRILCDKNATELVLSYDTPEKILVVHIPSLWLDFKKEGRITKDYTRIRFDEEKCQYFPEEKVKKEEIIYPACYAQVDKLKENVTELSKRLRDKELNVPLKALPSSRIQNDFYADGFSRLILSLAYLSNLMGCWVESIPCAVNVMEEKKRCLGVFIWGYYPDSCSESESPYSIYFRQFADKICTCFASQYIQPLKNAQEVKEKATAAAIAQAMARNMSHNIGSHVMSGLIEENIYGKLTDDAIKGEEGAYVSSIDSKLEKDEGNKQLAYFNRYLKNRMDYLSEVTFGVSTLLTTKMVNRDVLADLDRVRILLNRISGISNFPFTIDLRFDSSLESEKDVGVGLPGDVLGCQAFYNILENIIRNTAKHAPKTGAKQGPVHFTVCFKEITAEKGGKSEDADTLYCVEIDNGTPEQDIETLVEKQNHSLNESVLDEYNNLRSHSLGLLEMKASAAFLRQIDLPDIDSKDYQVDDNDEYFHTEGKRHILNVLKAFAADKKEVRPVDNNGKTVVTKIGKLGYRFFVQKPKEILFIGKAEEWGVMSDPAKRTLLNLGILFESGEAFQSRLQRGESYAHQFLVCQDQEIDETTRHLLGENNDCKTLLPLRKLFFDKGQVDRAKDILSKEPGKNTLSELKLLAWEQQMDNLGVDKDSVLLCRFFSKNKKYTHQVIFLNHSTEEDHDKTMKQVDADRGPHSEIWIEHIYGHTKNKLPFFSDYSISTQEEDKDLKEDQIYLRSLQSEPVIKYIQYVIFEAYHHPVIILDERVQKFARENREGNSSETSGPIPCHKLHASTNVLIPEEIPLSPKDFKEEYKQQIIDFVQNHLTAEDHHSRHIILVHYGILERMFGGNSEQIDQLLNQWSALALRVVVTSGRGAHSLPLPPSVCYVNLSSVLNACNENRLKYLIFYLMSQARRKNREKGTPVSLQTK